MTRFFPRTSWISACLAAALALAFAAPAFAQTNNSWTLRAWRSDDGLPNNNVLGVAQTSDGYLWVANVASLSRFDGAQFETFALGDFCSSAANRKITHVLESRNGGLWVVTDHGTLICLISHSPVIVSNLPTVGVQSIAEDAEGGIWLTFKRGNVLCHVLHGTVTTFQANPSDPHPWPGGQIATDVKGRLWYCKAGEIGRLEKDHFVAVAAPAKRTVGAIRLAAALDGGMWVFFGANLWKCDVDGTFTSLGAYPSQRANVPPSTILEDHNGNVWIGTGDNGLLRYSNSGFESVPTTHRQILSLCEDSEGNMWIGTAGGGLNRLQTRTVRLEGLESGLPSTSVQSICEDTNGNVWAVTQNGFLARRTGEVWTTLSGRDGWPAAGATSIAADRAGSVWLGTENTTLYALRNGQLSGWIDSDGVECTHMTGLVPSASGDLWIGGDSILQRFRDEHFETIRLPTKFGPIVAMAEDSHTNIWVATQRALLRVLGRGVVSESEKLGAHHAEIRCLYATPDGVLWIGFADDGVGWLRGDVYEHITSRRGLLDNAISQIAADDQGWMWFGCDRGIFKTLRTDLENVAARKVETVRYVHYGASAGVPGVQANFGVSPGVLHSRDGHIWLPMSSALAVANPSKLHEDAKPPPVILKRISVDDLPVASYHGVLPYGNESDLSGSPVLQLQPGHHRLEFEFTASSLTAPENVRFRYQLEGIDEKWVDGKTQRSASYSRLPAGRYRFWVTACNSQGVWSETGAAVTMVVAPFIWQTWWFRLSAVAAFTAIIFTVTRYVAVKRMRSRMDKLEQQAALDKSRLAGMSEVASSVLHNVGNVLNNLNVSNSLVIDRVRKSKAAGLDRVVSVLNEHSTDLPAYLTNDPKGKQLPGYIAMLASHLTAERTNLLEELSSIANNIEHIKGIVASQQTYAQVPGVLQSFDLKDVVEDAIRIHSRAIEEDGFELIRDFQAVSLVTTDKHKVLQILNNLLDNARRALEKCGDARGKRVIVRISGTNTGFVKVSVIDNGIGISAENLTRIFQQTFVRTDGHGIGLHSGANAARELGGTLNASSDGAGKGATFTLEFPVGPATTTGTSKMHDLTGRSESRASADAKSHAVH